MSIAQTSTTSFKTELLQAVHNFGPTSPNTFKIALYTAAASLDATTTVYSTANEVTGTGYTAGGNTLVIDVSPTATSNSYGIPTAYISFTNTSWATALTSSGITYPRRLIKANAFAAMARKILARGEAP